jgi:nanoRNase/pAp phosphatase (c-di-AMP/oligoRNAs hydrolase)
MSTKTDTQKKLAELRPMLAKASTMAIVLQDSPDPDALGAAVGLRQVANDLADVNCSIVCGGHVGRAENRALVRYLQLNLRVPEAVEMRRFDLIAMVDTQPGLGNNSLPDDVSPHVVIDHHLTAGRTRRATFTDVRSRYGATSTILHEYLLEAGVEPDVPVATALLYGIRSDTQDFGRESTQADIAAYEALYPLANKRMLGTIQRGQVSADYFRTLAVAIGRGELIGNAAYCSLGELDNTDMIAEVADLLLRHEKAGWSLCWGQNGGRALLSLRTNLGEEVSADQVMKRIVSRRGTGGGHDTMAGGQIPIRQDDAPYRKRLAETILRRYLKASGNDDQPLRRVTEG